MRILNPALAAWLKTANLAAQHAIAAGFKPTPVNMREILALTTRMNVTNIPHIPVVLDDIVPTGGYPVPVRIYHPSPLEKLPVLVYFHGGGHVSGSVSVYDPICRKLAMATRHVVVSAEYRLAPECAYPAGLEDAIGVVRYVWRVLDDRQLNYRHILSIAGDSGGGALCASVSGKPQFESDVDIKRQVLIYPSVDYTLSMPSVKEFARGFLLEESKIFWYFNNYFQHGEDYREASPLFWKFTKNLPETFVITAGFCPLRDEGKAYAQKVRDAGVYSVELEMEDMIHAFVNMENIVPDACRKLYAEIAAFMQRPY